MEGILISDYRIEKIHKEVEVYSHNDDLGFSVVCYTQGEEAKEKNVTSWTRALEAVLNFITEGGRVK